MTFSLNNNANKPLHFEYYSLKSSDTKEKSLIESVSIRSIEVFQNMYYYLCNAGIAIANSLRLYNLKKKVIYSPTDNQLIYFYFNAMFYIYFQNESYIPNSFASVKNTLKIFEEKKIPASTAESSIGFIIDAELERSSLKYIFTTKILPFITGVINYSCYEELKEKTDKKSCGYYNSDFRAPSELVLNNMPIASTINKLIQSYYISKDSLLSLKGCWKIFHKKPKEAIESSIVHISNIALSTYRFYISALYDFNTLTGSKSFLTWGYYYSRLFKDFDNLKDLIFVGIIINYYQFFSKYPQSTTESSLLNLLMQTVIFSQVCSLKFNFDW